ncbi:ribose-phosphate pyrophosphokinase [Persicimonas caeni]|uniref:Ribose-phosphate pyrophosphokinase n=1 Tax=Persicimonas caeni TaxID=2292766 RepID=A0A4Y6PP30_PERCE|nr:ribose-phosphate pyrophosphokinase [Persicimonas caeni]QDG50091.1 ribose-phosphate pyrophosphokinase [Persicimonas caeni]QED31312.1 ribose-phosphate pyrophosphokinase [Persicimonas caeni]
MDSELLLFAGNSNPELAEAIASYLNIPVDDALVGKFSDGEIQVQINTSVRDFDVYLVQSLSWPVNDNLMEMLVMMDALRRASARRITAVIPYFGYARQDRQPAPRTPITAKLVANMLELGGADRVVAMDLHAGQIQGFFTRPFEHLYSSPVLLQAIRQLGYGPEEMVIVSPDAGGVERARHYSKTLKCPLAILDKRRSAPNVAEVMHLIGDVEGKHAVIVDDMIDTAGTLTKAAAAIIEHGAASVYAAATHPILSGPAVERIANSQLEGVIVTDTIPLGEQAAALDKIGVVSVAKVFGEAIRRIHGGTSVSSLFTSINS